MLAIFKKKKCTKTEFGIIKLGEGNITCFIVCLILLFLSVASPHSQNACKNDTCPQNASCLNGFSAKGFMCECPLGFRGSNCEIGE